MGDKQHEFGRPPRILYVTAEQKAELESENAVRQFLLAESLFDEWRGDLRLTGELTCEFHRLAINGIYGCAGEYRDGFVSVGNYVPPKWQKVPGLVEEMCEYANRTCNEQNAISIAAFLLWRLNWIHPFHGGNGRTARIISYLALCVGLQQWLPGRITIPQLISDNDERYYDSLRHADRAWASEERVDVSRLQSLLNDLLIEQLESANLPE